MSFDENFRVKQINFLESRYFQYLFNSFRIGDTKWDCSADTEEKTSGGIFNHLNIAE